MIGHGSNSCSRSGMTGAVRTKLSHPTWSVGTGPSPVPVDQDQRMDDDPPLDRPSLESLEKIVQNPSDSDYGPWLLVSRRRGSARGRGGGTRATHVTRRATAAPNSEVALSRGSDMRNIHGGRRAIPSGRPPPSPVTSPAGVVVEQSPNQCISTNPPVVASSPDVSLIACEVQDGEQPPLCALPPVTSN